MPHSSSRIMLIDDRRTGQRSQSVCAGCTLLSSLALIISFASPSIVVAQQPAAPSYTREVQPFFDRYCSKCHNAEEKKGNLALDTLAGIREGGKHGAAFITGKSAESLLVQTMLGTHKPKMPPKGNPVPSPSDIEIVKRWIDAGAHEDAAKTVRVPPKKVMPKIAPKILIRSVAYSPNAGWFAVAFGDRVRVVDLATDYIRSEFITTAGQPNSVRVSSDGKWLVVGIGSPGRFGAAELRDSMTGKLIRSFEGHKDSVYAAEISLDRKLLATAGYDRLIKLWDVDTGKLLHTLKGHNEPVYSLSFRGDGKLLASACTDRTVKLWNTQTGARLDTFSQSTKDLNAVAFSPKGDRVIAGGADNRIRNWRISATGLEGSNELLFSKFAHQSTILALAFSPDGRTILSTSEDRKVKLWDAATMMERRVLELQPDWCHCAALAPDSKTLLVGRHDGSIALYDAMTGSRIKDVKPHQPPPPRPELLAVYPRGIRKGQTSKVRLRGKNLWPIQSVIVSNPSVTTKFLSNPAPKPEEVWLELSTPGQMQRGDIDLSVSGAGGKSSSATVWIDDIAQVEEPETPNAGPIVVALPATIWGGLNTHGSKDEWAFDAKKDQRIVFDLAVRRIKSSLEPVLEIIGPDGRAVVDEAEEGSTPDDAPGTLVVLHVPRTGRYRVRIRDLQFRGSPQHTYRLSAGEFPFVIGTYPSFLPPNKKSEVELIGYNLAGAIRRTVLTGKLGQITIPIEDKNLRSRRQISVQVGSENETFEVEPNDVAQTAMPLSLPFAVSGRFWHEGKQAIGHPDVDLYRFTARKGEPWIFETEAARIGSPSDTRIEILDAAGNPVPRVVLQAVRDSEVHFRNIASRSRELRCTNWEEMELNEYMYLGGEVVRLFRLPQGPDSGFLFYPTENGARRTFFETTPTSHAVGDPCYIVEVHPPGTKLTPNGLPTFSIPFANDDAEESSYHGDSKLTFTPPTDGIYIAKVSEIHAESGPDFTYRLTARRPSPDFSVRLNGWDGKVVAGVGKELSISAHRTDGFTGEIRIDAVGLPKGITVSLPTTIEAGHLETKFVLYADPKAASPSADEVKKIRITATAIVNGVSVTRAVTGIDSIAITGKPTITLRLEPADVTIVPGKTVACWLVIDRHGFKDRINFNVSNLPHGVFVDNIGLNGILIPPNESRRQIFLTARKFVKSEPRPFFAIAAIKDAPASPAIKLHVQQ